MVQERDNKDASPIGKAIPDALELAPGMEIVARHRSAVAPETAPPLASSGEAHTCDRILVLDHTTLCAPSGRVASTAQGDRLICSRLGPELEDAELLYWDGTPVPPEDTIAARLVTGEPVEDVRRVLRDCGGQTRHLLINAVPVCNAAGDLETAVIVVRDVTDRLESEDRIAKLVATVERRGRKISNAREQLETLIQALPVPVIVCSSHRQIVKYNPAALSLCESLGIGDWLRRRGNFRELGDALVCDESGRIVPFNANPVAKSLRGEECRSEMIRLQFGEGPQKWLSVNASPLKGTRGWQTGVIVVAEDVTRLVVGEQRLRDTYRRERALTEKLQAIFLPIECPSVVGLDIAERYHGTAGEAMLGGDFYDVFRLSRGKFGVVMADVAGRGLKSAVYTGMTKYMLRAYALETSSPDVVLEHLNDALYRCTPDEVFITLIYGVIDSDDVTFTYANAGHEQPVIFACAEGVPYTLDITGRALALTSGSCYSTREVALCGGDVLALYTDGITDAGTGGSRFGVDRLLSALQSSADRPASDIADAILEAAKEHAGRPLVDDAALLIIKAMREEQ